MGLRIFKIKYPNITPIELAITSRKSPVLLLVKYTCNTSIIIPYDMINKIILKKLRGILSNLQDNIQKNEINAYANTCSNLSVYEKVKFGILSIFIKLKINTNKLELIAKNKLLLTNKFFISFGI